MKENGLYRKEAEDLQRKLDKMIADGAEEWDLKNAVSQEGAKGNVRGRTK